MHGTSLLEYVQLIVYLLLLVLAVPIIGNFFSNVYEGENHFLKKPLNWLESGIYKVSGIDSHSNMSAKTYLKALIVFELLCLIATHLVQVYQSKLPFNPENLADVPPLLAFNTAVSFVTNTNWQAYSGESTLSYFSQAMALTVQNFLSAAVGMAVCVAFIRGLVSQEKIGVGNFWKDLVRSTVYILLPFSIVLAVILMSQGVPQSFSKYMHTQALEGAEQVIPLGPAASQIAIKQLGTNGGGFYGVNSAHPFENPTPLSNFLQMLALLLIPAGLVGMFGKMVKNQKQAWVIFGVMFSFLVLFLVVAIWSESKISPITGTSFMEGKETRFGVLNSVIWSIATTAASNGSVNAMHDSLSPLTGGLAMLNIQLGEIIFGGVGSGLYGMLLFAILTVFLAGLMVGRTPEYFGKKIQAREVILASIGVLIPSFLILIFTAVGVTSANGLSSLSNKGPHGLSEILYAFTSSAGNNGSAFGGLNVNTPFYNLATALCMLVGRFGVLIPVLLIAGELSRKKRVAASLGTFPTDRALFGVLLFGVILIVGALTFFPALLLGPGIEHLLMNQKSTF